MPTRPVYCARKCELWCLSLVLVTCHPVSSEAQEGANRAETSLQTQAEFDRLLEADWREVVRDPGTKDWRRHWFLDGRQVAAAE